MTPVRTQPGTHDETVEMASQEVNEKTGDTKNQNTKCAWPTMAADSLQEPPDMLPKE